MLPLVAALALAGCKSEAPEPVGPVPETFLTQKAACEKRGGRWGQGGSSEFFICYMTTRDAG